MNWQPVLAYLTTVALAALGGGLVAVPVALVMRSWLVDMEGGSDALVLAVGYGIWVLTSATISAVLVRRAAGRR